MNNRKEELLDPLKRGKIGVIDCDTILGIVGIMDASVADRIRTLKGKLDSDPFLLLVSDIDMANQLIKKKSQTIQDAMKSFWPGPVSLIVEKAQWVPNTITGNRGTVGLRQGKNKQLNSLIRSLGMPLISTSANLTGQPFPGSVIELSDAIREQVDFVDIDEGFYGGEPSGIFDLTQEPPRWLRPQPEGQ